tara:strand:+ start:1792 stop:2061 length:270 start_codon:yes stop_codon:yes gene_type:complete
MKNKSRKGAKISRRGMLPLLGGSLLIPFLGFSNPAINNNIIPEDEEDYKTLLKADGTTVKVRTSTLNKSKIVKKNISNKSFRNWLSKKL